MALWRVLVYNKWRRLRSANKHPPLHLCLRRTAKLTQLNRFNQTPTAKIGFARRLTAKPNYLSPSGCFVY